MQKTIFSIAISILGLCIGSVSAQETAGEIRYLTVHNWTKKMAALDYLSKQQRERIAYMWGSRSEWKVYTNLYFDSTGSRYEDSDEHAEADMEGYSWRKDAYRINRNFSENKVSDHVTMLGKTYVIEDSLQPQAWKILNDMKEVAGHVCMNAFWEDTTKQQKIIAWFALDMPVPAGPERFCGLPGLILEVDINDGAQVITADRIQLRELTNELEPPKKLKGKRIDEAEFQVMIKKHINEKRKSEEPWFWGIRY